MLSNFSFVFLIPGHGAVVVLLLYLSSCLTFPFSNAGVLWLLGTARLMRRASLAVGVVDGVASTALLLPLLD